MALIQLTDGSFVDEALYNAAGGVGYAAPVAPVAGLGTVASPSASMVAAPLPSIADSATTAGVNYSYTDGATTPVGAPDTAAGTDLGFNTDTLGLATQVGNLGLGYLSYKDSHAMNKQNLAGAKFNLDEAKNESAINASYRASYGLA